MTSKDIHLSKSLSWLLRHGAVQEGLTLSPEGYINVDKVLQHKSFKQYSLSDVERVVRNNDKQRFALRVNPVSQSVEIKANQGHSIEKITDAELTPILTAKYKTVVHGTYTKCWPQIQQSGLSRMRRLHIHLAKGPPTDRTVISGLRTNAQIHIFINLEKALEDGIKFYESDNGVILTPGNDKGFLEIKYFDRVVEVFTGYPPYTKAQDLAHVFCRFGDVRLNHEWITDTAACLELGSAEQARAAVAASRRLNVYGAFLTVRPATLLTRPRRQPRRRDQRVKQNEKGLSVEPSSIPLEGGFEQQLEVLLSRVRLSQAALARLAALYADVEAALQDVWPGCRAQPFGSVTTGLGVQSSDADVFVRVPPGAAAQAVLHARRALQRRPDVFADLLAIPRANTPIVKFRHLPTGVHCDLSFKTELGARNSRLVACLLRADPRLLPLALVLKYWARVHELSGTGRLTNYALTMLVVFYLQQPPRRLLPPVEWLQRDAARAHRVDCWNAGFLDDVASFPRSDDASSVAELLGGFFEFYGEFDFDRLVVCPFAGRPIEKDAFRDPARLPAEFALYRLNVAAGRSMPLRFMTPMCVQDPFEQCHNVASPVAPRLAQDIRAFCKFAAEAYARERPHACAGLLRALLLQRPALPRAPRRCRFRVRLPPAVLARVDAPDWTRAVRDVTFRIFEGLLRLELEAADEANAETARANGPTDADEARTEGRGPTDVDAIGADGKGAPAIVDPQGKESVSPEEKAPPGEEKAPPGPEDAATNRPGCEAPTRRKEKKTIGPKKTKPEGTGPAEAEGEGGDPPAAGASKKKEKYAARLTRAIWKRKRFPNREIMNVKFPERERLVTDDILRLDAVELELGFHLLLTFLDAPRAAFLDVKYVSGELESFKEFGYFINCTFNNWFVLLCNPYCKDEFNRKTLPDMTSINYKEECTDTDSDTDSYEDERIDPDAKANSKRTIEKLTESHIDYAKLQSVIEKINKNNTNNAVKEQSESDKNKSDTDKIQRDKNKPDHRNDKNGNPPDKSPPKKNKNRSPRRKKGKDSTQSSPAHTDSRKTSCVVANGPMP